jgi:hypothetical protein
MTPVLFRRASAGFFLMIALACTQSPEPAKETKEEKTAVSDPVVKPPANQRVMLPGFKITSAFLKELNETNSDVKSASKFICQAKFIYGLSQPNGMFLLAFPAKNHGEYSKGKTPFQFTEMEGSTEIDTEGIVFGNMELNWRALKQKLWRGNEPDPNFSHLLLTPFINTNKQLGYRVAFFDKSNNPYPVLDEKGQSILPNFNMNPSPPAEPNQ